MTALFPDTHPKIEALQIELWRQCSPTRKMNMLAQNEPLEVTAKVTGILEKLGVPYLIGGSLASTLYGMVRTTQGSDIVAEMQLEHLQPFVSALQNEFYLDDEMIAKAIQR